MAWMTWITITTQVPEKKGEHEMFELLQTGNTSLALFEEDREKRSGWDSLVKIATIANKYLTGVRVACNIGLLVHQAVAADLWGMCQALSAVCIYSTMQREIEEDQAAIQRIKTEEVELKRRIKITKLKMTRAFEVMTYSKVNINSVIGNLDNVKATVDKFERLVTENPALKLVLEEQAEALTGSKAQSGTSTLAIILEVTGFAYTLGDLYFETVTGDTLFKNIMGWVLESKAMMHYLEKFGVEAEHVLEVIQLAENAVKIVKCSVDQGKVWTSKAEERDHWRMAKIKALEEKKKVEDLLMAADKATSTMYHETNRLVKHTNHLLGRLGSKCRTNLGTIHADLKEINDHWEIVKQDLTLKTQAMIHKEVYEATKKTTEKAKEAAEAAIKEIEEMASSMVGGFGGFVEKLVEQQRTIQEQQDAILTKARSTALDTLQTSYAHLGKDKVIETMQAVGFDFPDEQWTEWNVQVDDEDCDCEKTSNCFESKTRTCLTTNCLGSSSISVDTCETRKRDLAFFKVCKNNEEVFAGECETMQSRTISEAGVHGVEGRRLASNENHGSCYNKCKEVPGATGCQLNVKDCPLGNCGGDCFAFTEKVRKGDDTITTMQETCYIFNTVKGTATESILKRVLDSIAISFGEGSFNFETLNAWMLTMARTDKHLLESQENGWKEMIKYQSSQSDRWGDNPSNYTERDEVVLENVIDQSPTSLQVFERCNFASNFAYYNLMHQVHFLVWMPPRSKRALVQASAALTLGSSFFHGSHTQLGQLMDNLMIKIIAYTLYEAYINALNLPTTTPKLVLQLKAAGRPMTGIELAQDITDMLRLAPSDTWMDHVKSLDVPKYESTFGAFILAMDAHAKTGDFGNWKNGVLLQILPVEEEDKDFLREFDREVRKALEDRTTYLIEEPDSVNRMTTGLKLMLAFIFQENIPVLNGLQPLIKGIGLSGLNDYLDSINTLPKLNSSLPLTDSASSGSYPGEAKCSSAHAQWHSQSAQGLLDLFKLVDELVRKQVERKDKLSRQLQASNVP